MPNEFRWAFGNTPLPISITGIYPEEGGLDTGVHIRAEIIANGINNYTIRRVFVVRNEWNNPDFPGENNPYLVGRMEIKHRVYQSAKDAQDQVLDLARKYEEEQVKVMEEIKKTFI